MLKKTTFALATAVVVASGSAAFAQWSAPESAPRRAPSPLWDERYRPMQPVPPSQNRAAQYRNVGHHAGETNGY